MGRQALYQTEEERQDARRTRTRHHVRVHRCRKKLAEQQGLALTICSTVPTTTLPALKPHLNVPFPFLHLFGGTRGLPGHHSSFEEYVTSLRGRSPKDFNIAEFAWAASAAQHWGRETKNQDMIRMSHELCNEATTALRRRLTGPCDDLNHGLLLCLLNFAAIVTELMENVSQPCAKATWLVLYKAGMQLMRKAGPAAFANSWGIAYLELNRQSLQLLSLLHGDDFFLNDETWRTIPYHGTVKTPITNICDIGDRVIGAIIRARQISSLLAGGRCSTACQVPGSSTDRIASMLEINRSLDNWLIDVKHGNCNELYKEKQTELWFEIQVETLAVSYQFSSLRIAAFVNAYWFYKLLLLRAIVRHAERMGSASLANIDKLTISAEIDNCALHLCRSQEYITLSCCATTDLSLGWLSCFMLRLAATCFVEGQREDRHELVRWCAELEDYKQKKSFPGHRDWYVMASVMQDARYGEL